MRDDHEFTTIHHHLKKRLNQKKRTWMSIWAFLLHALRPYAQYPNEMSIKFTRNILKIKLIEQEDKTAWFHKREWYRTQLNQKLKAMWYANSIHTIKIL